MSNERSSPTIIGLLGIAFIVLKLTHYIDWSWWWVLIPFWGGFALLAVAFILWLFLKK
jgi:hypothetical protein